MARAPKQAPPTTRMTRAVRRVVDKGWTTAEAARRAGIPRTTLASRLTRAGVRTRPSADPARKPVLLQLVREGVTPTDAAALMGVARATAYRWMRAAGYTRSAT